MHFKHYSERANRCLSAVLPSSTPLRQAMRYSVLSGGKRFRPILTYVVANTFNSDLDLVDSSACAIELIHAYSLVHDDLPAMDDDDMRHNQPACHKRFGTAQAILAGDALQALAFEVLANDSQLSAQMRIDLLQSLSSAALEMAQGQSIDLSVAAQLIDLPTLQNMHQKKTGALLSCAAELGAIISCECTQNDREILADFTQDIGLAYQIQDDVLDVLTPETLLGRKQNSDIDKNKPTYPAVLGLDKSRKTYQELYAKASARLDNLSVNTKELRELTQQLHSRKF